MKILLSAYACEPNKGSELGNGWNWASMLAKSGHQIVLFTRGYCRSEIDGAILSQNLNIEPIYVDTPKIIKKIFKGQIGVFIDYYAWQYIAYRIAKNSGIEVDVIHHATWGSLHGGSLMYKLGKPMIFGPIGGGQVAPKSFIKYFGKQIPLELIRSFVTKNILPFLPLTRQLIKRSSVVLTTNEDTRRIVNKIHPHKAIMFIDTGIDEKFAEGRLAIRKKDSGNIKVMWIGRLMPRKALLLAIEAMSRTHAGIEFTIIGDGEQGVNVEKWISENNLEHRCAWMRQIPWEDVKIQYGQHDMLLFTSLRDSCPAQLLEAMSFGLPIVMLDHQGGAELVPDSASIKIKVDNPQNVIQRLAEAVDKLAIDYELRESMKHSALEASKLYNWKTKVEKMENIMLGLIK